MLERTCPVSTIPKNAIVENGNDNLDMKGSGPAGI